MRLFILMVISFGILNAQIVKSSNNTVIDTSTKLQWQDNASAKTLTKDWKNAIKYCKNLTLDNHSDWRLPTIKELRTIRYYSDGAPALVEGFKNSAYGAYWASTPYKGYPKYAWGINFFSGYVGFVIKHYKGLVRCVRNSK